MLATEGRRISTRTLEIRGNSLCSVPEVRASWWMPEHGAFTDPEIIEEDMGLPLETF